MARPPVPSLPDESPAHAAATEWRRGRLPAHPVSWYLFGEERELRRGPVTRELLGRRIVAYRTSSGQVVVMEARCSHLGADLGRGCVVGERIRCPYHEWEYAPDGRCVHVPASSAIPPFARQRTYAAEVRHGLVFFFAGHQPLFPLPFFAGVAPHDLVRSTAFSLELDCPWYMVGANAFDFQHLRAAHERRLLAPPLVEARGPFTRRARSRSAVEGASAMDWLTRWLSGPEARMMVDDWGGNLFFVTVAFRRRTTYGFVTTHPLAPGRVRVTILAYVRRSGNALARAVIDPLNAWLRSRFIRAFVRQDGERLPGTDYRSLNLVPADDELRAYFDWLSAASRGRVEVDGEEHSER